MEVKMSSETYRIHGNDETGLIPEGVCSVVVEYNSAGGIESLFYALPPPKDYETNWSEKKAKEYKNSIEEINKKRKTPEEMGKIVGLLKKLVSKDSSQ